MVEVRKETNIKQSHNHILFIALLPIVASIHRLLWDLSTFQGALKTTTSYLAYHPLRPVGM